MASGKVRRGEFWPTAEAGRGLRHGRPKGCGAGDPWAQAKRSLTVDRGEAEARAKPG